ncbi:MAG: Acetyltransferase domain [Gammaproteobacteria bacterium]|jgi:hypothetical protein|nr:Acetyltransferase domain [Gammaproteobacteria bacterium]
MLLGLQEALLDSAAISHHKSPIDQGTLPNNEGSPNKKQVGVSAAHLDYDSPPNSPPPPIFLNDGFPPPSYGREVNLNSQQASRPGGILRNKRQLDARGVPIELSKETSALPEEEQSNALSRASTESHHTFYRHSFLQHSDSASISTELAAAAAAAAPPPLLVESADAPSSHPFRRTPNPIGMIAKLRLARANDCTPAYRLFKGLLSEKNEKMFSAAFMRMSQKYPISSYSRNFPVIVILEDDQQRIIGAVSFVNNEIIAMRVNENEQGKGYGKLMLSMVAKSLPKHNAFLKLESTEQAQDFWKSQGFIKTGNANLLRYNATLYTCIDSQKLANLEQHYEVHAHLVDRELQDFVRARGELRSWFEENDELLTKIYAQHQVLDMLQKSVTMLENAINTYEKTGVVPPSEQAALTALKKSIESTKDKIPNNNADGLIKLGENLSATVKEHIKPSPSTRSFFKVRSLTTQLQADLSEFPDFQKFSQSARSNSYWPS